MDPTEVARLLDDLGRTADEVAATLKTQGVRGVRNTVRFLNPVVRYVSPRVAGLTTADVMRGDVLCLAIRGGRKEEVALPQAIRDFPDAFNRRAYPELELPEESI